MWGIENSKTKDMAAVFFTTTIGGDKRGKQPIRKILGNRRESRKASASIVDAGGGVGFGVGGGLGVWWGEVGGLAWREVKQMCGGGGGGGWVCSGGSLWGGGVFGFGFLFFLPLSYLHLWESSLGEHNLGLICSGGGIGK